MVNFDHSLERYVVIINLSISKYIDTNYVSDDDIRISMHKEISKIKSRDQISMLIQEYTDRYGKPKEDVLLYMEAKYLEFLLKSKGIESFKETEGLSIYLRKSRAFRAICEKLHFTSLEFQSIDGIIKAIGLPADKVCTYCWNGKE